MGDVLKNREHASQLKIFAGLKWGQISPTDIDAFLDFCDRLFVFIEVKHGTNMPPTGQRLALERICDACERDGRLVAVLVAAHSSDSDIQVKDLPVIKYRWQRQWITPKERLTVQEAVDRLRSIAGISESAA